MLDRMGHTRNIRFITEISYVDVKGSTGLVGLGIVHQKSLELIVESNNSVIAIIK
jgi:hypothetical protein